MLNQREEKTGAELSNHGACNLVKWSDFFPVCGKIVVKRKITAKLAVIFRLTMMKLQTTIKALAWIGNQNVPYQNLHGFTTNQALLLLHRITLEL